MTKKKITFFQERAHKKQENITKKILIVTKMRLRECVDQIFLQVVSFCGRAQRNNYQIFFPYNDDV